MMPASPGLGVLIALVPAAVRLWTNRSLARSLHDAAIGERLLAAQRVNGLVLGFAIAVLLFYMGPHAWWLVPSSVLAYAAAAYPLRRALYEETWSLAAYLWFTTRLSLAVSGFWILLAFMPVVARAAGGRDWIVSAALTIVLLAWSARYPEIVRGMLRARPMEDSALRARFERLAASCAIPMPLFEQVDMRGGVLANAIALASLRRPAIIFTDVLLQRLDPDESTAICAHELAHIEYFTPSRLRRLNAVTWGLIALGAGLPVAMRLWEIGALIGWAFWTATLLAGLMWIARDHQKNETASDLRAVAMTGDGEALVRALTKGYAIARMPRRLHPDFEKHATHPSLAKRIRDIREAAGASPVALNTPAGFNGAESAASVIFGTDRLQWVEGDAATHSLSYSHLSELRVHAPRAGRSSLVAVETGGRRWEMALAEQDVARLQAVLDIVDGRLARGPVKRDVWPRAARVVSALLMVVTLPLGQFAAVFVALLAALRPSAPLLAGTGAAGLTAAWLVLRDQGFGGDAFRIAFGILCAAAAVGAGITAVAVRDRKEPPGWRSIALIAVAGIAAVSLLAVHTEGIVRLHTWARSIAAAAVFPMASAGALAFARVRRGIWLAIPLALAGVAVVAAGSPAVLDALEDDALLLPTPAPVWKTIAGPPVREFALDFYAAELRLSPTGRYVAVSRGVEDHMSETFAAGFHVGEAGGPLVPIEATDVAFVSDEDLLAVAVRPEGMVVRQISARTPDRALWEQPVRNIGIAQLSVEIPARRWQLLGTHLGRTVRVEGQIGRPEDRREMIGGHGAGLLALAAAEDSAIAIESTYEAGLAQSLGVWQLAFLMPMTEMNSRVWRLTGRERLDLGASQAETRCVSEQLRLGRLACVVFDGTRSRIVTLDARSGRVEAVAAVNGRLFSNARVINGWMTGWHDASSIAVRLDGGEAVRIAHDVPGEAVGSLRPAATVLGAVIYRESGSLVRLYATDD